jgi:hypothetical protein
MKKVLNLSNFFYLFCLIGIAFLSLLVNWTPSGESWGYWFFNKELLDNGNIVINDRSPLFIVYLTLFSWLEYPLNIITQYFFSASVLLISFVYLLKKYTWPPLILVASAAWLPFIMVSEPPTQALAMAFSNFAIGYRVLKGNSKNLGVFYLLLFCSFFLRGTYLILLLSFVVYDLFRIFKKGYKFFLIPKKIKSNFIFLLPILIIIFFTLMRQSPHPFNNAYFISTDWMPTDGKSMTNASFIQAYHERYIIKTHGKCCLPEHHMFYEEEGPFGTSSGIVTSIKENPRYFIEELFIKSKDYAGMLAHLLNYQLSWMQNKDGLIHQVAKLVGLLFVLIMIYYALAFSRGSPSLTILVLATIATSGLTIFFNFPKLRYMVPWAPIFIFSYLGFINHMCSKFFSFLDTNDTKITNFFNLFLMILILYFVSYPSLKWSQVKTNVTNFIDSGQISILETSGNNTNLNKIMSVNSAIGECEKVLATTDALFVGAFTKFDLYSINDYWIFPPSKKENIEYTDYLDMKFNCIFVSNEETNSKAYQYENFVIPLQENIIERGGYKKNLPGYGTVTILPKNNNK